MYILNGIVYGGEPMNPVKVLKIKVLPDKIMLLTFSNGETRLFDATILEGEVFNPLNNEDVFSSAVIDHGIVTWANGEIDCAPEYMYQNSYSYQVVA
ncbi:MAG: DUF2442 domain-containing protein [Clostridiales bacterium]|nr:DUF2442 domain-containing protein [Clostridiales bacterium]